MSPEEAKQLIGQSRLWQEYSPDGTFIATRIVRVTRGTGIVMADNHGIVTDITQLWCDYNYVDSVGFGDVGQVWFTPATFLVMPYAPGEANRS